jgi:hypothetical protein
MQRRNGGEPPARRAGPPSELGGRGHCLSHLAALRCLIPWAEDRAPWRHDPGAVPGTKPEGRRHDAALSFPSGLRRKRQIEALWARVHHLISRPQFLHFTLNHDRPRITPASGADAIAAPPEVTTRTSPPRSARRRGGLSDGGAVLSIEKDADHDGFAQGCVCLAEMIRPVGLSPASRRATRRRGRSSPGRGASTTGSWPARRRPP